MKAAQEQIEILLPEINLVRRRKLTGTLRAHRVRALAFAKALAYWALEAPELERAQGPGMPGLPEHEWRIAKDPRWIA
jgi:hypothetical protein